MNRFRGVQNLWVRLPEWVGASLGLGIILLIIFARVLFRPQLMIIGSDFIQFYFWEYFTRAEWAVGNLPVWNPYFFSGYPQLANPQTMVFYPPAILLRLVPLGYALGLGIFWHQWWAGLGMFVFARAQKMQPLPAFFAALIWMLNGVIMTHIEGGHLEWLYTIAWLAWVLWAWHSVLENNSWWSAVRAGLLTALMFLAGGVKLVFVSQVMLLILGGWWLIARRQLKDLGWTLARLILGGAILLGVTPMQWLPTLEFTNLSSRAAGIFVDCTAPLSLTLGDLPLWGIAKIPYDIFLEWERNAYVGAIGLGLAVVGMVWAWRPFNFLKMVLVSWLIVGLMLGFGPALPFYGLAQSVIPGLSVVRQPFTFVILIGFALSGLAGVGLQTLLAPESPRKVVVTWWGVMVVLGFSAVAFDVWLWRSLTESSFSARLIQFSLSFSSIHYALALGVGAWWWRGRARHWVWVLGALLALDLGLFAYRHIPVSPEKILTDRPSGMQTMNAWEGRVLTEPYMHSAGTLYTLTANAQGYAPIALQSYADFTRGAEPLLRCPELGFASINKQDTQLLRLLSVNFITAVGQQSVNVSQPYPRMSLVPEVISAPSSLEAIKLARASDYDPTQKIYVEGVASQKLPKGESRIRVTQYGADSFTVLLDSTEESWFYINDVWYPGWKAWVNGAETKVFRANGTFRAVPVPKGQNTLFMRYESTYLNLGMWISGVTCSVLLILWLWQWQVIQKMWRGVAWYFERVLGEDD